MTLSKKVLDTMLASKKFCTMEIFGTQDMILVHVWYEN
jgi:hypothetical protein